MQINAPNTFLIMDPWPGPQYFQKLKTEARKWQEEYGKDEVTGRDSVFVRCAGEERSNWIQFDIESKLPVRVKQWENANWEGEPYGDYEQIVYNLEIPDDTFNFTISANSLHINDHRKATPESEKTFTIEIPDGTCKFPEIVEDALKERAKQESTTKSE